MRLIRQVLPLLVLIPLCGHAEGILKELTVTAQKREQLSQDVGIALTTYTEAQMKELGFENSIDIASMSPNVHISGNNGGQKTLFSIRGVTQNDFNDHTEAPVAVYIDEGYVAFGQGQLFGLFDLDRVEILKGPQGTLFGRNATGGLVHFLSHRPTETAQAYADGNIGSYGQKRLEAAISGPITTGVLGRFSMLYDRFNPIIKNDYPNRAVTLDGTPMPSDRVGTFNDNTLAFRGQLLLKPHSGADLLLIGHYGRTIQNTSPFLELPTVPIFDAAGNHVGTIVAGPNETREAIAPDGTPINHPLSFDPDLLRPAGGNLYGPSCTEADRRHLACGMDFTFKDLNHTKNWGFSGKLTWDLGHATFTSISDYKKFDKFQAYPADGGPASTINAMFGSNAHTFTQELRLDGTRDRFRWVTGLYYLNIGLTSLFSLPAEPDSLFEPLVGVPWEDTSIARLRTHSTSVFGQTEFDLTKTLTLVSGVRAIREDKEFTGEETFFLNTDPLRLDTATTLFSVQPRLHHDQSNTLWSGKLQLEWRPSENMLLYGGINRGVKAGGFNAPATFGAGFPAQNIPYGPEVLLSYEVGFKSDRLLGGTTRINGSAFYYDYKDYQGFFFTQVTGYVTNVNARYLGAELELVSQPVRGLELMLNGGWLNADVFNIQIGPGIFKDSQPSFAPPVKAAGLVRYEFPGTVLGGRLHVQGSADYAAHFYDNIRNFAASKLPSYWVGNLRLGWQSADAHWDAALFVNNVADRRYYIIGFDLSNATGSNSLVPGRPRWYGINVRHELR